MRRVGVREPKEKATALIAGEKAVVIEKHGKPVGFYLPLANKDKVEAKKAADWLEATIADILERTGMTEDEFVAELTGDPEHRGARGDERRRDETGRDTGV